MTDDDKGKRSWRSPRRLTEEERRQQERVQDIVREHGPISTDDVADHLERGGAQKPNVRQSAWATLRRLAGFEQVKDINQESGYEGKTSWWVVHQPQKRPTDIPDPVHHEPGQGTGKPRREAPGSRRARRQAGSGLTRPADRADDAPDTGSGGRKESYYDRLQREREEREAAQRVQRDKGGGGGGGGSGFMKPASAPDSQPPAQDQQGGAGFMKPAGRPDPPPDDNDDGGGAGIFKKT